MNISLTPELERFVSEKIESGRYTSASEVVREALRLLAERERLKREQWEALEQKLVRATEQLDRGEGIPIEDVRQELRERSARKRPSSEHA